MSEVKKKKPAHYVDNKRLHAAFLEYHMKRLENEAVGKGPPKPPNYIGEAFMLICTKLSYKYNFINYSYRDEMVGDAIENCCAAINSFDPINYKNPHAYYTQIAWNAFIRRIDREKKQAYVKYKTIHNGLINDLLVEFQAGDDSYNNRHNISVFNDSMSKVVESFESKKGLTKKKKKSTVGLEKFIGGNDA